MNHTYLHSHSIFTFTGRIQKFVIQLLSCVQFFATPWTAACQASPSFTVFWSLLKLMSIESMITSNHLILCCPLLLFSTFPSIKIIYISSYWVAKLFEIQLQHQSFQRVFRVILISFLSKGLSRTFSSTTVWKHQFLSTLPSLLSSSRICTWLLERS